ncbi:MAG: diguanylate cyclase [Methylotenera sp.]|nr:diguanylate cyclase [Methylotenera sp.]
MAMQTQEQNTMLAQLAFSLVQDTLSCKTVEGDIELLTGYSAQDFISSTPSFGDIFHADDIDLRDMLFSHAPGNGALLLNLRLVKKDGQIAILSARYRKESDFGELTTHISISLNKSSAQGVSLIEARALANLTAMFENTDDYIYFKDKAHAFTGASQTLVNITHGVETWQDLIGKTDYEVFPAEYADIYYSLEKKLFNQCMPMAREIQPVLDHNGKTRWVDNRKYAIYDKSGDAVGLFGIARDVTEIKLTEAALRKSEERTRLAMIAANQAWFDLEVATGEVEVSDEYPKMLGYTPQEFHTNLKEWQANLHPDDAAEVMAALQRCMQGSEPVSTEYRRQTKEGGWIWLYAVAKVIDWGANHEPLRMIGIHMDISERKKLEEELRQKAYVDYLTEVNNRGHFMELAEKELARSLRYEKPLAIFMIDIDWFKRINDSHGHKLGDAVLKRMAGICRTTLREVDIIGRIGGEEFAILLPETEIQEATEVAERLRSAIAAADVPLKDGLPVKFTVSIGVASVASQDDNMDVLLNRADDALYQAKESGRNKVCVAAR